MTGASGNSDAAGPAPAPGPAAGHPLAAAAFAGSPGARWAAEIAFGPVPGRPTLRAALDDPATRARLLAAPLKFEPRMQDKMLGASLVIAHSIAIAPFAAACLLGAGLVPRLGPEALGFDKRMGATAQDYDRIRLALLDPAFAVAEGAEAATHPDARPLPDRAALQQRMRQELEAHLAPVVEIAHRETTFSRRAGWRLAGDALGEAFLELGQRTGQEAQAREDALAILKRPGAPMTNPQMRFLEVVLRDPERPGRAPLRRSFRARGGCCLWKNLPGAPLCATCVLRSDDDMRAQIEAELRRSLGLPVREAEPGEGPQRT